VICLAAQDAAPSVCMKASCNSHFSSCELHQNCAMTQLDLYRSNSGVSAAADVVQNFTTGRELCITWQTNSPVMTSLTRRPTTALLITAKQGVHTLHTLIVLRFAMHLSSQGYDHQTHSSRTATQQAELARSHAAVRNRSWDLRSPRTHKLPMPHPKLLSTRLCKQASYQI